MASRQCTGTIVQPWTRSIKLTLLQGCPVCGTFVEKSMGCNHMICGVCSCHFCFLCGDGLSARNPYSHYSDKGLSCYGKLFEGLTGLEDPFGGVMI